MQRAVAQNPSELSKQPPRASNSLCAPPLRTAPHAPEEGQLAVSPGLGQQTGPQQEAWVGIPVLLDPPARQSPQHSLGFRCHTRTWDGWDPRTDLQICSPSTGLLRPASPTTCDIPARPGAEPCKRWDIMDNKSHRKIVGLLGPLSSLPLAACRRHEPCDHEARSSCKYTGSLTSRGPGFILLRR